MPISEDIINGEMAEFWLMGILANADFICDKNVDKKTRKYWDIECKSLTHHFKIEVKYDRKCAETGNFAIEVHNPKANRPTGLSITKSELWSHILSQDEILITSVSKLKSFIKKTTPKKVIQFGGDGNAQLWIYPKDDITKIFCNLSKLDNEAIQHAVKTLLPKRCYVNPTTES
jgi:hypothetical protein